MRKLNAGKKCKQIVVVKQCPKFNLSRRIKNVLKNKIVLSHNRTRALLAPPNATNIHNKVNPLLNKLKIKIKRTRKLVSFIIILMRC